MRKIHTRLGPQLRVRDKKNRSDPIFNLHIPILNPASDHLQEGIALDFEQELEKVNLFYAEKISYSIRKGFYLS